MIRASGCRVFRHRKRDGLTVQHATLDRSLVPDQFGNSLLHRPDFVCLVLAKQNYEITLQSLEQLRIVFLPELFSNANHSLIERPSFRVIAAETIKFAEGKSRFGKVGTLGASGLFLNR